MMKKQVLQLYPYYCAALLSTALFARLFSVVYRHYPTLEALYWFWRLLPALVLCACATILHNSAKKQPVFYLLAYFLNSVASGIAISALLKAALSTFPASLLLALIPAAILGLLSCALFGFIQRHKKLLIICLFLSDLAFLIFGIRTLIVESTVLGFVYIFSGLFFLPFPLFCAKVANNPAGFLRYLSFSGYGAFWGILFVVLLCLTEGEAMEALDLPSDIISDNSLPSKKGEFSKKPSKLEKHFENFITAITNKIKNN